jgi:hypothetical protein
MEEQVTEVSVQAKLRACELANSEDQFVGPFEPRHCDGDAYPPLTALARYIQQVSDAAKAVDGRLAELGIADASSTRGLLAPFILPDPVDPLLIEAKEIVRASYPAMAPDYNGRRVTIALAALKRGMELAGSKS